MYSFAMQNNSTDGVGVGIRVAGAGGKVSTNVVLVVLALVVVTVVGAWAYETGWRWASAGRPMLITELPMVIEEPGRYRLASDLEFADTVGTAILIASDDVDLDLDGRVLKGTATDPTRKTFGVRAHDRKNIRVRDGVIRGFATAVLLWSEMEKPSGAETGKPTRPVWPVGGHEVLRLRVQDSTFCGIRIRGRECAVRDCRIERTGGMVLEEPARVFGVDMAGKGSRMSGNIVREIYPLEGGEAVGLSIAEDGENVWMGFNTVNNLRPCDALVIGLWVGGESEVEVVDNVVSGVRWGCAMSSLPRAKLERNIFADCEVAVFAPESARADGDLVEERTRVAEEKVTSAAMEESAR